MGCQMDCDFVVKNCEIDRNLQRYAEHVLSQVVELSPEDSEAVAMLEKSDGGYWFRMDIRSVGGPFVSRYFANNAREAIDGAVLDMRVKLFQWNRSHA